MHDGCGADVVMCSAGGVGGGGGRMTGVGPCSALVSVTGRGRWNHSGGGRDANDVLDMDVTADLGWHVARVCVAGVVLCSDGQFLFPQ